MATDEEKKKQGLQTREGFNVPGPQAAANNALGDVANRAKQAVVGPPSIGDRVKGIGNKISTGFNQAAEYLSNKGNAAINKSADTIALGDRLTQAAPIFGSTQPGKDIVKGLGDAAETAFTGPQSVLGVSRKVVGGMADAVAPYVERVASDYEANEKRFGRDVPDPQGTGELAAGVPQGAAEAAGPPVLEADPNMKREPDPQITLKNDGIYMGNRKATPMEIEAFRTRAQAGIQERAGSLGEAAGASPVQQVGNMDVQFDPSVSPEAREAFMRDPVNGVTRQRSGTGDFQFDGGPRVSGPNPYGAKDEQAPEYVTRETHPNLTGEAATAINRQREQGYQARLGLGVTGQNKIDQIGAQGLESINLAKQYGLNSLADTQLRGQQGLQEEGVKGQMDLALEQYKQQNADKYEHVAPKHDKKGNLLEGTGIFIPKDPYNLGQVDPKNLNIDQIIKLRHLQEYDLPMYEKILAQHGIQLDNQ